ncbi:UDP-N-acetyl-D-glucosamine dehydrogenase [Phycisphaerales bacterium]|nr:UDP-N-acetyl-D-glucosamine dehydrogenase [Phycisphaerales bacterium]
MANNHTPETSTHEMILHDRIVKRKATVGVVGLGYVGLPLIHAMHNAGFTTVGFDIDAEKIRLLKAGKPYLEHLGREMFRDLARSKRFTPTNKVKGLAKCDAIAICVPTPLGKHDEPDLSYVVNSTEMVARVLHPGMLVSLESTTYPGTTREICKPILERGGLVAGRDFFLCFSPEREDPGRKGVETRTIPRLVGGLDPASGRLGHALYSAAVERVMAVSSAEVAESAKLLENIYRAVNIALVNELKPVLADMGIDIWEVIAAAATKPFGFQPFYPGPGLGGHCIPIDPYYLTYKAREYGHVTRFIELAGLVNRRMPEYVVERLSAALNQESKSVKGSRILVVGIAYKPDVDDVRETPAAEVIRLLSERGAQVSYHDPHVPVFPSMRKYRFGLHSVRLTAAELKASDAVLIITDHAAVDYAAIGRHAPLVVDTRNAMSRVRSPSARVVKA